MHRRIKMNAYTQTFFIFCCCWFSFKFINIFAINTALPYFMCFVVVVVVVVVSRHFGICQTTKSKWLIEFFRLKFRNHNNYICLYHILSINQDWCKFIHALTFVWWPSQCCCCCRSQKGRVSSNTHKYIA